jgi:hypothetical protein
MITNERRHLQWSLPQQEQQQVHQHQYDHQQQQPVRTFPSSFYFTQEASMITSCTGSISAVSSALIMVVILRSHSKLSSTYHRIIFFISFW